jgi:hypothetical protein
MAIGNELSGFIKGKDLFTTYATVSCGNTAVDHGVVSRWNHATLLPEISV